MSDATTGRDQSATPDSPVDVWRDFFHNWPSGVPRAGVLVTTYAEQIPFGGFLITSDMLLLDRRHPDTTGARKVLIPFQTVDAVKFTDVLSDATFLAAGFCGSSSSPGQQVEADESGDAAVPARASGAGGGPEQAGDGREESDSPPTGGQELASAKYLAEQIKRRQEEEQRRQQRDTSPVDEQTKEEEEERTPGVKLPAWALRR